MCNFDKFPLTVEAPFIPKTRVVEPNHGEDIFILHTTVGDKCSSSNAGVRIQEWEV